MSVVANVAVNLDSRDASSKLRGLQSQAQQTERAFGGLGAAVGKLAIALGAIEAARFVFVKTAEIETQTRSLEVLTGSATKAAQIIQQLQQLGAATPFTSTELIDSAKRLQAFGVETEKVVETTRRLADVSGATGAELQGLVTAYGQVQAKGRLQGEELLQFQERGVALQKVLREEYKLSGEEFQDALSKGRISAEAVEYAIKKLTDAGGKYANGAIAQSDTLSGRLSTLQDGIEGLARSIGVALSPAIKAVLNEAIFAVNTINQLIATGARARSFGLGEAQRKSILNQAQQEAGQIVEGRRIRNPFERNRQFQELAAQRERDLIEAYGIRTGQVKPVAKAPTLPSAPPPLLMPTGGGKGGKGGKSDAEKEAEKLAKELQRSLERGNELFRQFSRQAALLGDITDNERKRLQIQYDFQDRAREINELKDKEQKINLTQLNDEIKRLEIIDLQIEALKKQAEEADKLFKEALSGTDFGVSGGGPIADMVGEMKQASKDFIAPANQVKTAAEAIGGAFSTSFKDIITGAESAQQGIADFFKSIGDALIEYATMAIAQYIAIGIARLFAGLDPLASANKNLSGTGALSTGKLFPTGAFAEGGFVTGPTRAMVGEGGEPEYIIPASKMSAAMARYSTGARGKSVIPGSNEDAGPATTMGAGGPIVVDVRYNVERINSVDYVTAEQFQTGMQQAAVQGASQGERRALRSLQQSTSIRRRVGMR